MLIFRYLLWYEHDVRSPSVPGNPIYAVNLNKAKIEIHLRKLPRILASQTFIHVRDYLSNVFL